MGKQEILVVDDEPINISVLAKLFKPNFSVRACKSGADALRILKADAKPDLILLDIMMPGIDGFETLTKIHENPETVDIPVIFISALDSMIDENRGFALGAVDYITKPFKPAIVMARVNAHLELKHSRDRLKNQNQWLEAEVNRRIKENLLVQDMSLNALIQLAETRDKGTRNHIVRVRKYIEILARQLQKQQKNVDELNDQNLQVILKASPLHDIGKIGIPDAILLKPGRLTEEEFNIIKTHCAIGSDTLRHAIHETLHMNEGSYSEDGKSTSMHFFEEAEIIIRYHHEKWDGTGYPQGLKGKDIPLSARLVSLADVFDALTISRVYKRAWSMEEASEYIQNEKGKHFDPDIVDAFLEERNAFEHVLHSLQD
jgi:putative two-component system response regulator